MLFRSIGNGRECGIVPDWVFGIEVADKSGRKDTHWFFLEADRGTMPIVREDFDRTSILRKLLAYEATWKQDIHQKRFQWNRFRVLTVTTNPQRVQGMIDACRQLNHARGSFLFTDVQTIRRESDLLLLNWRTVHGKLTAALLD